MYLHAFLRSPQKQEHRLLCPQPFACHPPRHNRNLFPTIRRHAASQHPYLCLWEKQCVPHGTSSHWGMWHRISIVPFAHIGNPIACPIGLGRRAFPRNAHRQNTKRNLLRRAVQKSCCFYDSKASMPAQANAATTQKMNDRQPDTVSVILSMMFMHEFSLMARRRPSCILPSPTFDTI